MSYVAHIPRPATIPAQARERLRILYMAKHASGDGSPDAVDGNHAVYHHELRTTIEMRRLRASSGSSAMRGRLSA